MIGTPEITPIQNAHLELIRRTKDGKLLPEDVLDDARNPNSPLHDFFTWDNTEAATAYRLMQAEAVIRVSVRFIQTEEKSPQRARITVAPARKPTNEFADEDSARHKFLRLEVQHAKAVCEIAALEDECARLQTESRSARLKLTKDTRGYTETEAFALDQYIRGVPLMAIVKSMFEATKDKAMRLSEADINTLAAEFHVHRPSGWTAETADKQWKAVVPGTRTDGRFGIE
jgi:hypothetical protein